MEGGGWRGRDGALAGGMWFVPPARSTEGLRGRAAEGGAELCCKPGGRRLQGVMRR